MKRIVSGIALILAGVYTGWTNYRYIHSGVFTGGWGRSDYHFPLATDPGRFWVGVAVYAILALVLGIAGLQLMMGWGRGDKN